MALRWSKSRQMEFDDDGERARAARAFFYVAQTTEPLTVYADAGLSTAHTHPLVADDVGRWPDVFIPFSNTNYKEIVTTQDGNELWSSDDLNRQDPVEAAEITVDENSLVHTGQIVFELQHGKDARPGYVRCNGLTIGHAAMLPSPTERTNTDVFALYEFLWQKCANASANKICPVLDPAGNPVASLGASATADWNANRPITLPDMRGAVARGTDNMGSGSAGQFAGIPFETAAPANNGTHPGAICGSGKTALTVDHLPQFTPTAATFTIGASISWQSGITAPLTVTPKGVINITDPGHLHNNIPTQDTQSIAGANPSVKQIGTLTGNTSSNPTGLTGGLGGNVTFTGAASGTGPNDTIATLSLDQLNQPGTVPGGFSNVLVVNSWAITLNAVGSAPADPDLPHPNMSRSVIGGFYIKL